MGESRVAAAHAMSPGPASQLRQSATGVNRESDPGSSGRDRLSHHQTASLPEIEPSPEVHPFERRGLLRRVLPFALVLVIAEGSLLLSSGSNSVFYSFLSLVLLCVTAGMLFLPWSRLPAWMTVLVPIMGVAYVLALSLATTSEASGIGIIILVPLIWTTLFQRRWESFVVSAAIVMTEVLLSLAPVRLSDVVLVRRIVFFSALLCLIVVATHYLRDRLHVSLERRAERLQQAVAFAAAAEELTTLLDPHEVLAVATRLAAELIPPPRNSPRRAQYNHVAGEMIDVLAEYDENGQLVAEHFRMAESPNLVEAFQLDMTIQRPLVPEQCGPIARSYCVSLGVTQSVYIPIHLNGRIDGILSVPMRGGSVTLESLDHCRVFGNLVELALRNAHLHSGLERQAITDDLTGLPNRRAFDRLIRNRRDGSNFSIISVDVDGLKDINDTYGHGVGDEILVLAAQALQRSLRPGDLVARIGGDEFAAFLFGATNEDATLVGQRILASIREVSSAPLLNVSLGIASGGSGTDPRGVLVESDGAMYGAKRNGGAQFAHAVSATKGQLPTMDEEHVSDAADRDRLVLIVDDDEAMRESLNNLLHLEGIRTVVAGRVDQALELFDAYGPAVVVLDYYLPDGSGIELARMIKERDHETPVLLLTGFATMDTAVDAVGTLDAYLIKPVAPRMFIKAVQSAIDHRQSVTERRRHIEDLQREKLDHARHDPLTGLPNRVVLAEGLKEGVAVCAISGRAMATLFIGLDRFKVINDLFGHQVGDEVLREMAHRLSGTCPESDCVARFGGDTFVVACPHAADALEVQRTADRLLEELARPVMVAGTQHQITASIGLVVTQPDAEPHAPEVLLRDAELAMFKAKDAGRDQWTLYDRSMRTRVMERFEVERGLRTALHEGSFEIAYQPIVDAHTSLVVGAEALLRWDRPGIGMVLPSSFMDVAEESGLIIPMGMWALDRALSDLARFAFDAAIPGQFRMWVNVAPQQLAVPQFAELVYEKLSSYGLTPDLLGLEIIEQALLDVGEAERVLSALRAMGVALNLDDFGAGHSNLWWLQELPITGIKIDRRFIDTLDAGGDDRSSTIAGGLVQLGHSLALTVVAEGVESATQAASADVLGCDLAQGYFYGFPGSAEQLWQLIAFERESKQLQDVVVPK
jgi:diguanylate cyclase (GGDEF)-like protein